MTVLCPKTACDVQEFATPSDLAAHLIDAHLMSGLSALALARQTAGEVRAGVAPKPVLSKPVPPAGTGAKEATVASNNRKSESTCHACGKTGHTRRSPECPKRAVFEAARAATPGKQRQPKPGKLVILPNRFPRVVSVGPLSIEVRSWEDMDELISRYSR